MQINDLLDQLSAEQLLMVAKSAQTRAQNKVKSDLKLGDEVTFNAGARGIKIGILIKKNPKTFNILVGSTTWKVSPTLLRKVA
jgi:hypothetical protein